VPPSPQATTANTRRARKTKPLPFVDAGQALVEDH
jgi:hypothetical protein